MIKKFCPLAILVIGVFSYEARAFKWQECKAKMVESKKQGDSKKTVEGKNAGEILGSALSITTDNTTKRSADYTSGMSSSTTSYVSSSGPCSAFALRQEEIHNFIADGFLEIRRQIAGGGGDYVVALSDLYGCEAGAQQPFAQQLKRHYADVFGGVADHQASIVGDRIEMVLLNDKTLSANCFRSVF